jgi:hypothetical protein
VVTFQLNRLRRLGLLRYNRKYIEISVERVQAAIRQASESQRLEQSDRSVGS